MNIYFAGAIRGGREDVDIYQKLIYYLKTFGDVLTEHVGDPMVTTAGNDGPDDHSIHNRDMRWLNMCDVLVAEVTVPSLGVGYELGWASALGKPILALYRPDVCPHLSAMIAGCSHIKTVAYSSSTQAEEIIRMFLESTFY